MERRKKIAYATRTILLIALALVMALPLYYIVVSSFKLQTDMFTSPFGLPKDFTFDNYVQAFDKIPVLRGFINTIVVTAAAVFFQVLIGSLAAYGMILGKSRFTAAIGTLLLVSFSIPAQATMIPIYQLSAKLHTVNTLQGLILIYLGSAVFCYYLIVGYMRKLPRELFEAARLDGASPWRIYYRIVLPLCRPILITVVVFQVLGTWNDFMWPNVFLSSRENRTIVLQVFNATSEFTTNWPLFMAITVIALLPVFIFFIFTQKWIVSGLVAGAVKG